MNKRSAKRILVTGATGYVGARLLPYLLDAGYHVRVLVRDKMRLNGRSWQLSVTRKLGHGCGKPGLRSSSPGRRRSVSRISRPLSKSFYQNPKNTRRRHDIPHDRNAASHRGISHSIVALRHIGEMHLLTMKPSGHNYLYHLKGRVS